jgi:hypothetical protein
MRRWDGGRDWWRIGKRELGYSAPSDSTGMGINHSQAGG